MEMDFYVPSVSHSASVAHGHVPLLPQLLSTLGIFYGGRLVSLRPDRRPRIWMTTVITLNTLFPVRGTRTPRTAVGFRATGPLHEGSQAQHLSSGTSSSAPSFPDLSQLVYVTSCALVLSCSFRPSSVVPVGACLFCVVRVPPIPLALSFRIR